nr:hypothetical protein [Methanosarcina barkeri]
MTPIKVLAGISGHIKLQNNLFFVSSGPITRKINPPVTNISAVIHWKVVVTAGGS